jgi:hypothetical protein
MKKKKNPKRLHISKETLVHLQGGSDLTAKEECEDTYSPCRPDCISTDMAICKQTF